MALKDRLKHLRTAVKKTQSEFAASLEIATSSWQYYERGERSMPAELLSDIVTLYGVNPAWLLSENGKMFDVPTFEATIPHDFVTVPVVNGRISAGTGVVAPDSIESCMCFRKDWICRKGDPKNMSLVFVSGDSMEDTISNGDMVLVDHSKNYIHDGGLYAICVDDAVFIKRLQPFGNKIQIISDNTKYPPLLVDASALTINGKAIWYGHDLSD